jgi:hypothetical protein
VLGEAQDLGVLLLAERLWNLQTEELVRIALERINAAVTCITSSGLP